MMRGRIECRIAAGRIGLALALGLAAGAVQAEPLALDDLLSGVVQIKTQINPDGRTVDNLGRERTGSGIVIDDSGLVLTIGYLMVEAYAAEIKTNDGHAVPATVVGYDHETGFGLLRAILPMKARKMALGKSADVKTGDPVIIAAGGGPSQATAAHVVSKREFAGSWEYMLDEAIYTAPPHPTWSGAALINRDGELLGVGSLVVGDASGEGRMPGNLFVPVDALRPILADLLADGHRAGAGRPWLGMSTMEAHGRLAVVHVTPGGPADKAGIKRGDVVFGIDGEPMADLPAYYRKMWSRGGAGVTVPLDIIHNDERQRIELKSINRIDHLKLKSTF